VDNGQKLQEKQIILYSKSKMVAVCCGPSFLLKYLQFEAHGGTPGVKYNLSNWSESLYR